ncbi:hypothetical protein GWR56_05100 [Mucilaginibacter sp. 14171R-50]|uniref:toxin-antitoxin system YwqK family antitoxin n=1 Tax=Mucilaginibacter sp. 14171R-50 TaxID=2703789 RepID=UPI00138D1133|nr:hypothetical protein [Mucilaginibacter sp. 14171R-50]QHS54947.1 hypothetical protein GWR56_05100 [Mucilaginibacter sp. 14171R-50]
MYFPTIIKRAFTTIGLVLLFVSSKAQSRDTLFYSFRDNGLYETLVSSLDSADFIRIIPPFRLADDLVEVKEIYKNGKLKLTGTGLTSTANLKWGTINLNGYCIRYFQNGKRRSITNYNNGQKQGLEYYYYPDGSPHQIVSYKLIPSTMLTMATLQSFFTKDGKEICTGGEGMAYEYDENFRILRQGHVHIGLMNGEWHGYITGTDSAKYTMVYKNNTYVSGTGYDTLGKAHPFTEISQYAVPVEGRFKFVERFRKLVKQNYKQAGVGKMLDSSMISFTIREDGSLSDLEPLNAISADVLTTMKEVLAKCPKWKPATFYGIPLRATVGLSLHIQDETRGRYWVRTNDGAQILYYKGVPLDLLGNTTTKAVRWDF